jgi:hypothetical protein
MLAYDQCMCTTKMFVQTLTGWVCLTCQEQEKDDAYYMNIMLREH